MDGFLKTVWGCQDYSIEIGWSFQQTMLGKSNLHMQKYEIRPLPQTYAKINKKMDQRPKHEH